MYVKEHEKYIITEVPIKSLVLDARNVNTAGRFS
jgi:hypothetical protein